SPPSKPRFHKRQAPTPPPPTSKNVSTKSGAPASPAISPSPTTAKSAHATCKKWKRGGSSAASRAPTAKKSPERRSDPSRRPWPAPYLREVRQHRHQTPQRRKNHRPTLDLLPRRHGLPPRLRSRQREPVLQPRRRQGRLRLHLRNHLRPAKTAPLRRPGTHR